MMRVRVDQAGNDFLSFRIDYGLGRVRQDRRLTERHHLAVADGDIGVDESSRSPNLAARNEQIQLVHED